MRNSLLIWGLPVLCRWARHGQLISSRNVSGKLKKVTPDIRAIGIAIFLVVLLFHGRSAAQVCNRPDTLNTANHNGVTVSSGASLGSVTNPSNVIGPTSASAVLNSVLLGNAWISVTKANPSVKYPAGMLAGFNVSNASLLGLLSNITISTYSGGALQESVTGSALLITSGLLSGTNNYNIAFVTTRPFDNVYIRLGGVLSSLAVYYGFVQTYCPGPALACNTLTPAVAPVFPVSVDAAQSGVLGLGTITGLDNVVDANTDNYASINTTVGLGTGGNIAIKDNSTTYPAGTFAAFEISCTSLLGITLLNNITISTYKAGVLQESRGGSSLLMVNPSLLSSTNGRSEVGFVTSKSFDEVMITVSNTLALAYTLNVYDLLLEKYCSGPALSCNRLTSMANPEQPVYVDGSKTGIDNILTVGGGITNAQYAIDNDTSTYANITLTASVATVANFTVGDAVNIYPANSFAGFDVQTNTSLLTLGVLNTATISLYRNDTLVQTGTGSSLIIGATSSLLASGSTRQVMGIVANVPYNKVKIAFNQPVSATLGDIRIYGFLQEKTCPVSIACGSAYYLKSPSFPVVIDNALSGVSGIATVDASIADPWNVVSPDSSDYARISNNATVAASASIAVLDPLSTYPRGTFAGFVIKPGATPAILLNLLNAISISTYNNGVLQETANGASSLISLTALVTIIGTPPGGAYNLGFYTSQPFDEIRITVGSLLNAGLLNSSYVDVYGAFIDSRASVMGTGSLTCVQAYPDVNAGLINQTIPGNVSTNDVIAGGANYSASATPASAPAGSTPVLSMNTDGSYSFITDKPGVYVYNVQYCLPGQTAGCAVTPLTISVLDPASINNPPVVNNDLAITPSGSPVTVRIRANDGPGNPSDTLGMPTIVTQPKNGTAVINAAGELVYTPGPSFSGVDTVVYQVCAAPSGKCATAQVFVTVMPGAGQGILAADDYIYTSATVPASGNVLINDRTTSGNILTVTPKVVTLPGTGVLTLNANGSYLFVPDSGFVGTVSIPYTAVDAVVGITSSATLYLVVDGIPDLAPTIAFLPAVTNGITNVNVVMRLYEFNGYSTNGLITVFVLKDPRYVLSFNPAQTTLSGYAVNNNIWTFDATSNPIFYILTTNVAMPGYGILGAGLTTTFNPQYSVGKTVISTLVLPGSGSEVDDSDNSDDDTLIYK